MALQTLGLDFFYLDVNFFDNDKIVLIESEYGNRATLLAVRLLCKIYGLNYYYAWGKDECLLFTHKLGGDYTPEYVQQVVVALVERGFFNKVCFEKYAVLTSESIQLHYFEAVQRRKQLEVNPDYLLVDPKKYKNVAVKGENVDISEENVCIPSENADILPQSKGKENKGKEIPPTNPPRGEVRQEDILSSIPQDGVGRNTKGLMEELQRLGISMSDIARLVGYCNYGEIGHPIWKALVTIRGANGQIKQPLQYIWARLRKQEG